MKKILAVAAAAALFLSLLSACAPTQTPASQEPATSTAPAETSAAPDAPATPEPAAEPEGMTYGGNDISKEVALRYLMVGTKQPDHELVWSQISDYIKTKINATITCDVIDMADHETRYSLVLASGEPYDLVVTAQGWLHYDTEAPAGAYKEITLDMIHQYMPLTTEKQTDIEMHMDQNRLANGKVFMVPASFTNLTGNNRAISIREDLRVEYGVPEVTDLASLEVFLDAVKANNPGMWPYAASQNNNDLKALLYKTANNLFSIVGNPIEDYYVFELKPGMTAEQAAAAITYVGDSPQYKEYAKLMKAWADKGYWSRSAIADTTTTRDAYENSQSALFTQNTGTMGAANNTLRSKDINPIMIDLYPKAYRTMDATTSGVAIPHSSQNMERALMFLDLLKYDPVVYELYRWGIEGKHWEWVDKANRVWKFGPDREQYVFGQGSWGFSSPEFEPRYSENDDPESVTIFNSWWADDVKTDNPLIGLNIDQTPIQNEISALTNVRAEYLYLLDLGLVDDVDATIEAMNKAAKAAGLDKVTEEIQKQISAWIAKQTS